ncbi:Coiled-coil domain-containing protein 6 [Nymphon striatum]|nr:Coiled-coil domain-containing protein 6 [Nymphon striatum]
MADSASESDSSSVDGGFSSMMPPSPVTREHLQKRIESLQQANRVMKVELETYKLRVKALQEENRNLRQASVNIQARAEQEEEYISNTLLKKIQALKKEKETLAINYEQEEECLTNDLSRKLNQLKQEKVQLEQTLEQEQECLVNKLMRKIEKLEAETLGKQHNLEQLRREKVELENTLEQEQEALVNKLWKRMDKLEAEKRMLQGKLDQPVSAPTSPRDINNGDTASNLTLHIQHLRNEVSKLKTQLLNAQQEHSEKMAQYAMEEKQIREENLRLQRKLQLEMDRRESLCRHLSESESSLEMDEERHFNEITSQMTTHTGHNVRPRTVSSPIPYNPSPNSSRPLSPGLNYGSSTCSGRDAFSPPSPMTKCPSCGQSIFHHSAGSNPCSVSMLPSTSPPSFHSTSCGISHCTQKRPSLEKFVKPPMPPPAHTAAVTTASLMDSSNITYWFFWSNAAYKY